jgi:hypothetical protein
MAISSPGAHTRYAPVHKFDGAVERFLGADMRLLYGMGVPVVGVSAVIAVVIAFAASPLTVAGLVALEVLMLVVVVVGFFSMLDGSDDTDPDISS